MKITLALYTSKSVEKGHKPNHFFHFEVESIPQVGDFITVLVDGDKGSEDFIVKRVRWFFNYPVTGMMEDAKNPTYGITKEIWLDCETVVSTYSNDEHKRLAGKDADRI